MMQGHRTEAIKKAKEMLALNPVYMDTETTGFEDFDQVIEVAIQNALQDAESKGLRGKAVTPYLLSRIVELTGGESMQANIALLKNNTAVAADIATALRRSH